MFGSSTKNENFDLLRVQDMQKISTLMVSFICKFNDNENVQNFKKNHNSKNRRKFYSFSFYKPFKHSIIHSFQTNSRQSHVTDIRSNLENQKKQNKRLSILTDKSMRTNRQDTSKSNHSRRFLCSVPKAKMIKSNQKTIHNFQQLLTLLLTHDIFSTSLTSITLERRRMNVKMTLCTVVLIITLGIFMVSL